MTGDRLLRREPGAAPSDGPGAGKGTGAMDETFVTYYWRGHGPLWKVYWLYGVLGSNVLTAILLYLIWSGNTGTIFFQLVLIVLAAYTVWIVVSVWRCAFNVRREMYGHLARALTAAWTLNAVMVLGFLQLEYLRVVTQ